MKRTSLVVAALLCTAAAPPDPLAVIKQAYKDAEGAYLKGASALPDTPDGQKKYDELWKAFDGKRTELSQAAVALAKRNPDSDDALRALEWVLTSPGAFHLPAGKAALDLTARFHAANPKVGKVAAWAGYSLPNFEIHPKENAAAVAFLRAVAAKNPDRTARGQAVMGLARQASVRFARAEYLNAKDVDKLAADAEAAFEAVVKEYADCRRLFRDDARTLGEEARQQLFDLRNLRLGQVAPEIEGEDLDGVKFKLSDYRGKVVMLVFCGDWCGPCRRMYPHERELVKRLTDKPFALVGVNSDADKEKLKKRMAEEGNTWRWFWNGPKGTDGPISRAWNVRGWPTVYVLDAKGVIRQKDARGPELDKAIDGLLAEMAGEKK